MSKDIYKHKISKYAYKYITTNNKSKIPIYAEKINSYLRGGYDYMDASDVIRYLDCRINNNNCLKNEKGTKLVYNTQPYMLVVYGPPASGKSRAKELMIKEFGLADNYINIDVDQLVYHTNQFQNFKNNTDISDLTNITPNDLDDNPKIQKIIENYKNIRSKTSFFIKVFIGIALMFNYNIVLETTGGGSDWSNIADDVLNYKYNIYLVYPYTDNIELLINRSISRGLEEHRFVTKKYFYEIFKKSRKNFLRVTEPNNIIKFKAIYVFDASKTSFDNSILFKYINQDGEITTSSKNQEFISELQSIE
jgi:hypothetical protein